MGALEEGRGTFRGSFSWFPAPQGCPGALAEAVGSGEGPGGWWLSASRMETQEESIFPKSVCPFLPHPGLLGHLVLMGCGAQDQRKSSGATPPPGTLRCGEGGVSRHGSHMTGGETEARGDSEPQSLDPLS